MTEVVPRRWGLGEAVAGMGLGFVAGNLLAGVAIAASGRDELTFLAVVLGLVGLWTGLLGVPVWASRRKGSGALAADFGLEARRRDALFGLPVGLGCQLLLVPLIYLPVRSLVDDDDLSRPAQELADKAHGLGFVLLAVLLVLGAPVVEELFFRGLLLRSLARHTGEPWAVVGSALAFGLAHFELLQFPALFAVGLVFGWLAVRTGRLGPGIWAHAAFNGVAVLGLALSR